MRGARRPTNHQQPHQPLLPGLERRPGPPSPSPAPLARKAEQVLARIRERRLAQAQALELALGEEERRTDNYLDEQARALDRVTRDPRLDALLACRRAGLPAAEAIARVERAFGSRS
jgi:hypothetical protein